MPADDTKAVFGEATTVRANYGKYTGSFTHDKTALQADVLRAAYVWRNARPKDRLLAESVLADAIDALEAHCEG